MAMAPEPEPQRPRRITGPVSSAPPPQTAAPSAPAPAPPGQGRKSPSATLLGVTAPDTPLLTPTASPRALYDTNENTGSMTREWRSTASSTTNPNLPPLDVPELTDAQIQELLALDGSPIALDVEPPPAPPRLEVATDLGLGPDPGRLLEIEAEPESDSRPNLLTEAQTMVRDQPLGIARRRDATTPDADVHSADRLAPYDSPGFDSLELTPTRDRKDLKHALAAASPPHHGADDDMSLPPLVVPPRRDEILEEGTNPTNPFIQGKLAEYSYPTGQMPRVDDLPPAPGILGDTSKTQATDGLPAIQEPLDRGDLEGALTAAENLVSIAGGIDGQEVRPHVWLLERVYESVVGSLAAIPRHGQAVANLDPRSAFLLSRLDGMSSVEDLLDVSGMPRLEALRCLALLVKRGVVTLG
jgi:hypothetical protein